MNARLIPWAAMALLVLVLAVHSALTPTFVAAPAGVVEQETAGSSPEILRAAHGLSFEDHIRRVTDHFRRLDQDPVEALI